MNISPTTSENIPPSRSALNEALTLSEQILKDIELSQTSLEAIFLKTSRLARLLNDFGSQKMFEFEASGYPSTPTGIPAESFEIARIAGRVYEHKDEKNGNITERANTKSIGEIERSISMLELSLSSAKDPNVSIASANPNQYVLPPTANFLERDGIRTKINSFLALVSSRRALAHRFVTQKHYEIKFSEIADDIFSRIRGDVDASMGSVLPNSIQKLTAIYENLQSDNPEDWSNAVHSCRRMLQDLADAVFPPREDKNLPSGKKVRLGTDNYINRLIAYIEEKSLSDRFTAIVGSNLSFIGDRLDAVFQAAQKGSHATITDRVEADRYVVYTYMIVGDILSISKTPLVN